MSRFTEEQYAQLLRENTGIRPKTSAPLGGVLTPVEVALVFQQGSAPPRAKYRNTRTADGFDSIKERTVAQELELRAYAGEITDLQRQVKFALVVNGQHICDYRSDFTYREGAALVVVDVKSIVTRKLPAYRIKFKLMQACHGITIQER